MNRQLREVLEEVISADDLKKMGVSFEPSDTNVQDLRVHFVTKYGTFRVWSEEDASFGNPVLCGSNASFTVEGASGRVVEGAAVDKIAPPADPQNPSSSPGWPAPYTISKTEGSIVTVWLRSHYSSPDGRQELRRFLQAALGLNGTHVVVRNYPAH